VKKLNVERPFDLVTVVHLLAVIHI